MLRALSIITAIIFAFMMSIGPAQARDNVNSAGYCYMGNTTWKVNSVTNYDNTHLDPHGEIMLATADYIRVSTKRPLFKIIVRIYHYNPNHNETYIDESPDKIKNKKGNYVDRYDPDSNDVLHVEVTTFGKWKKKIRTCSNTMAVYNQII